MTHHLQGDALRSVMRAQAKKFLADVFISAPVTETEQLTLLLCEAYQRGALHALTDEIIRLQAKPDSLATGASRASEPAAPDQSGAAAIRQGAARRATGVE